MKFLALALATLAAAAPGTTHDKRGECTPATYQCAKDPNTGGPAWNVCNTSGQWVFAGDCPPNTVCKFLQSNQSPYCVPPDYTIPS